MRTPAGTHLDSDEFELTLVVRDSQMNGSQPVKLPLTLAQQSSARARHRMRRLLRFIF
jgi:RNase P protein component